MIDGLQTTLIILQLHMPIMQKANHLRGYPKPSRPSVEHLSPMLNSITNRKRCLRIRGAKNDAPQQTRYITVCPAQRAYFTINIALKL